MSKEIKYNFLLSRFVEKELENIYEQYKKSIIDSFADNTHPITDGWQGDFASLMNSKISGLEKELTHIGDDILSVNLELKQLTNRMLEAEETAKAAVSENREQ